MKSLIILILFLCVPFSINAQTLNRTEIVGRWTAVDGKTTSAELPTEVKQMMAIMIDGFRESTWTFHGNGSFRISFKPNSSSMMEELKFLDNKLWKFIDSASQIRIGTKDDHYNHLVLAAERTDLGMDVYFSDTPIFLTLKKND